MALAPGARCWHSEFNVDTLTKVRRPGRPTKLTTAMRREFLALVRGGMASTRAAKALGVCPDTVTDWCRVNPEFSEALEAAREESLGILEQRVHAAARKDWRAAAWLLERRLPEEYGRKERIEARCAVSLEAILADIESRHTSGQVVSVESETVVDNRSSEHRPVPLGMGDTISLESIVESIHGGDRANPAVGDGC